MKRLILLAFGDRRVDATGARGLRNWFEGLLIPRAASASRALTGLSSMMRHAKALGLRRENSNPKLRRRKKDFEAPFLTSHEFAVLGRVLTLSLWTGSPVSA